MSTMSIAAQATLLMIIVCAVAIGLRRIPTPDEQQRLVRAHLVRIGVIKMTPATQHLQEGMRNLATAVRKAGLSMEQVASNMRLVKEAGVSIHDMRR